jgi:uncharacterized protein
MRALGIGLVHWAALQPLFEAGSAGPDVLELEPQTLWEQLRGPTGWHYRCNGALLDSLAALPHPKLLHGVGHPVGGSVADPLDPWPLFGRCAQALQPAWVSEHLSFNRIRRPDGAVEHAGFLLPPPQTPAAVRVAADGIHAMRTTLGRPVAFETGVNYLQPQVDELDDGSFFAAVAQASGAGIVLDLHNLWCNQLNGRQTVAQALEQLPLDQVWEVHLAGGMQHGPHWLDAHSGAVPEDLLALAARVLPRLPRLGALVFEILPEHLPSIGLDGVQKQLEALKQLWRLRPARRLHVQPLPRPGGASAQDRAEVAQWENRLVNAIQGLDPALVSDPGCKLYQTLITEFRQATLARSLRYTLTALLAGAGAPETHALLATYFAQRPPQAFAALEADAFLRFVQTQTTLTAALPHFSEVLAFELALVRASAWGESSELTWSVDPVRLLESLDAGSLPPPLPPVHSKLHISAAA